MFLHAPSVNFRLPGSGHITNATLFNTKRCIQDEETAARTAFVASTLKCLRNFMIAAQFSNAECRYQFRLNFVMKCRFYLVLVSRFALCFSTFSAYCIFSAYSAFICICRNMHTYVYGPIFCKPSTRQSALVTSAKVLAVI